MLRLIDTFQIAAEESTRMYGAALTECFLELRFAKYVPLLLAISGVEKERFFGQLAICAGAHMLQH